MFARTRMRIVYVCVYVCVLCAIEEKGGEERRGIERVVERQEEKTEGRDAKSQSSRFASFSRISAYVIIHIVFKRRGERRASLVYTVSLYTHTHARTQDMFLTPLIDSSSRRHPRSRRIDRSPVIDLNDT